MIKSTTFCHQHYRQTFEAIAGDIKVIKLTTLSQMLKRGYCWQNWSDQQINICFVSNICHQQRYILSINWNSIDSIENFWLGLNEWREKFQKFYDCAEILSLQNSKNAENIKNHFESSCFPKICFQPFNYFHPYS